METESVSEISVSLNNQTRLSRPANFIVFNRHDVSRIHSTSVFKNLIIMTLASFRKLVACFLRQKKIWILNIYTNTYDITSSSSLALHPFKFNLNCPQDRCPFFSAQISCYPSFHTHIPKIEFDIIHSPSSRLLFETRFNWLRTGTSNWSLRILRLHKWWEMPWLSAWLYVYWQEMTVFLTASHCATVC